MLIAVSAWERRLAVGGLLMVMAASCAGQPPAPSANLVPPTILHGDMATYDFRGREALRDLLAANVYSYFRFTSMGFAEQVCIRFADTWPRMPRVNLHGDAHIEQYAVTLMGRGLTDFDNAAQGPAILDLVRFLTSLRLSEDLRAWQVDGAVDAFFAGYREALDRPEAPRPEPRFVQEVRQSFDRKRSRFLAWAEDSMHPLDPDQDQRLRQRWQRYAELVREMKPTLPRHFFDLRRHGLLLSGVGSSFYLKFLARFEGPTRKPDDDVVLEAKEVRDLPPLSCLYTQFGGGGALRILVSQARIGALRDPFLAQAPRLPAEGESPSFWVQQWHARYRELSIESDPRSVDELTEIAYDVGVQLGRGHVAQIATPFDRELRAEQRLVIDTYESDIRREADELARVTRQSWGVFRRGLQKQDS